MASLNGYEDILKIIRQVYPSFTRSDSFKTFAFEAHPEDINYLDEFPSYTFVDYSKLGEYTTIKQKKFTQEEFEI